MKILLYTLLLFPTLLGGQILKSPGFPHVGTNPTGPATAQGSEIRVDTNNRILQWDRALATWVYSGHWLQQTVGCVTPAYTPAKTQSPFAVNGCTPIPELYYHDGTAWRHLNAGQPDTDEQRVDTFRIHDAHLEISLQRDGQPAHEIAIEDIAPIQSLTAGTGISVMPAGSSQLITNTGDTDDSDDLTTASTAGGDLSGPFSNLQIDPLRSKRVIAANTTVNVFGDSYSCCPTDPLTFGGQAWAQLLKSKLGATLNIYANSGRGLYNAADRANLNIVPGANTNMSVMFVGLNDLRYGGGGPKTLSKIKYGYYSVIAQHLIDTIYYGNDAAITKTGSWTSSSFATLGGKSGRFSVNGTYSKTAGDEITVDISGEAILIGFIGTDGVTRTSGTVDVFVDGVNRSNDFSLNNLTDGVTVDNNSNKAMPGVLLLKGLGYGLHEVRIVLVTSDTVRIDYIANVKPLNEIAPVVIGQLPRLSAAGYLIPPNNASNLIMAAGDSIIRLVVEDFEGYPVALAFTNDYWNSTMLSDGVHPSVEGHYGIYRAFVERIDAVGSIQGEGTAGYIPKWSTTTALTNSKIYDNGTSIGIGTASPTAMLHVHAGAGMDPTFRLTDADVSHGITLFGIPTTTVFNQSVYGGSAGGNLNWGLSNAATVPGTTFWGIIGSTAPAVAPVFFSAGKKNGTTVQPLATGEKAFSFYNSANGDVPGTEIATLYGGGNLALGSSWLWDQSITTQRTTKAAIGPLAAAIPDATFLLQLRNTGAYTGMALVNSEASAVGNKIYFNKLRGSSYALTVNDVVGELSFNTFSTIKAVANANANGGFRANDLIIEGTRVSTTAERFRFAGEGSLGINGVDFGGGVGVIFIANASTVPTTNPTGGGILYVEGGALKYRSPGGTITVIAPN